MSKKRPLRDLGIDDLESLFDDALENSDIDLLKQLETELTHRSVKRAILLEKEVKDALKQYSPSHQPQHDPEKIKEAIAKMSFGGTLRAWREYAKRVADKPEHKDKINEIWDVIYKTWQNKSGEYFTFTDKEIKELNIDYSPLAGILSHFGYRTKVRKIVRRCILEELVYATIPPVVNYREWGEPESNDRYNKIRLTLSGLPFPHRGQKNYEPAVRVWDEDHEWFMQNIYNERRG